MGEPNYSRVLLVTVIGILGFAAAIQPSTFGSGNGSEPAEVLAAPPTEISIAVQPRSAAGDYYFVRRDVRRCAAPLCGGFWVKRANHSWTQCGNRRWMRECYVAEIDWNGRPQIESRNAVLRGDIIARNFRDFGNLGVLRVTESWQSPGANAATGTFYRVRDRGVRCITHPCLSHAAVKLNANLTRNIAGVDLASAGASGEGISQAAAAMTEPAGVIVAGHLAPVRGPGGRAQTLKATQFYLRAGSQIGGPAPGTKRCFKTGCSSEVCADRDVITPCIFRPEFECYQKARCEQQANGDCGFTQTPELRACLERARP